MKARELITGEMIALIRDSKDPTDWDAWFYHYYWKVIGHKHD